MTVGQDIAGKEFYVYKREPQILTTSLSSTIILSPGLIRHNMATNQILFDLLLFKIDSFDCLTSALIFRKAMGSLSASAPDPALKDEKNQIYKTIQYTNKSMQRDQTLSHY